MQIGERRWSKNSIHHSSFDDGGFESIFDAILFLTILSLGSVLLQTAFVSSVGDSSAASVIETSGQARSTMEVFLRTWVYFDADADGQSAPLRGGVALVLNEGFHQRRSGEMTDSEFTALAEDLEALLDVITPSGHGFRFVATLDEAGLEMSFGPEPPLGRDIHHARGDWAMPALGYDDSLEVMISFDLALWIN